MTFSQRGNNLLAQVKSLEQLLITLFARGTSADHIAQFKSQVICLVERRPWDEPVAVRVSCAREIRPVLHHAMVQLSIDWVAGQSRSEIAKDIVDFKSMIRAERTQRTDRDIGTACEPVEVNIRIPIRHLHGVLSRWTREQH